VIVGGSGGVLEHEGEERKVRSMATWPKGLRGRQNRGGWGLTGGPPLQSQAMVV
jgi:hypothetical protein